MNSLEGQVSTDDRYTIKCLIGAPVRTDTVVIPDSLYRSRCITLFKVVDPV